MKEITSELLDSTYDAIELMNLLAQRLSDGDVGCREASSMSWLLGRAKERLEPVIQALEVMESNIEMGADADLIQLGSELLALHEKFRQRQQGFGGMA